VQQRELGSAERDVVRDAARIASTDGLLHIALPAPPPVPTRQPDGPGKPPKRYASRWSRHNLSLYDNVRAQIALFGDGNFTSGVQRVALLVGIYEHRE
jgi:hypothetical protein